MTFTEAVKILDLEKENINAKNVRKAYLRLSKIYHPDVAETGDAVKFKEILQAYEFIKKNSFTFENYYSFSREEIKKELDKLVAELTEVITESLYVEAILPATKMWLGNSSPTEELKAEINNEVNRIKPELIFQIESRYDKFSENLEEKLDLTFSDSVKAIDISSITEVLTENLTQIIGYIATIVTATISGGSGMAMIATGPLGLVLGGILGAWAFSSGKERIKEKVENYITYSQTPIFIKDFARRKIVSELEKGEKLFREKISIQLKKDLEPIYKQIKMLGKW